jgi:hypothetical protein
VVVPKVQQETLIAQEVRTAVAEHLAANSPPADGAASTQPDTVAGPASSGEDDQRSS